MKAILLALVMILVLIPTSFPETIYARVGDGSGQGKCSAKELGVSGSPEYVESDGELFVRSKRDWGSLVFDYGKQWEWTEERIAEFRRRNPQLDEHWAEYERRTNRLSGVYGR